MSNQKKIKSTLNFERVQELICGAIDKNNVALKEFVTLQMETVEVKFQVLAETVTGIRETLNKIFISIVIFLAGSGLWLVFNPLLKKILIAMLKAFGVTI